LFLSKIFISIKYAINTFLKRTHKEQKERMVMVRSHLEFIHQSIATLDEKLDKMVAPYENAITLLCTIPGVDGAIDMEYSEYIAHRILYDNPKELYKL